MTAYNPKTLYDTLAELELFPQSKLDQLYEQSQKEHAPLDKLIVDNDLITDNKLGRIVADILNLPLVNLYDWWFVCWVILCCIYLIAHKFIKYGSNIF